MCIGAKIVSDGMAVFKCTKCHQMVRDDTHYFIEAPSQAFKVTCSACGHVNKAVIENRHSSRKKVFISGVYKFPSSNDEFKSGSMTVQNISWQGFKLRVSDFEPCINEHDVQSLRYEQEEKGKGSIFLQQFLTVGQLITIEFFLDNTEKTFISRRVYIRWRKKNYLGAELIHPEDYDPSLRFYLLGLINRPELRPAYRVTAD